MRRLFKKWMNQISFIAGESSEKQNKYIGINNFNGKFEFNVSIVKDLINTYFVTVIPSLSFSLLMVSLMNNIPSDFAGYINRKKEIDIFGSLIIAPIFETAILILLIKIISEKINSEIKLSICVGILSSLAHAIQNFGSLLSAMWSFYIFSRYFMKIERKYNYRTAFIFSVLLHFCINLTSVVILILNIEMTGA